MNEKKHIDRLFQEKFKHFEPTPDDAVWENIQKTLHNDKRKRRVIPLWWKIGGVAAILALLFTVGNTVFNTGTDFGTPVNSVVGTEKTDGTLDANKTDTIDEQSSASESTSVIAKSDVTEDSDANRTKTGNVQNSTNNQIAGENSVGQNNQTTSNTAQEGTTIISNSKNNAVVRNTPNLPQLNPKKEVANEDNESVKTIQEIQKEHSQIAQSGNNYVIKENKTLIEVEQKDVIASNKEGETIEDAIAKANPTNEEEKVAQPNRWNISPNVAPVYFNTLGKGSSIDGQFVNNDKNSETNMSYGISGSYAINDKIKVRAGINKVNLGYSTNGVVAFNEINSFDANSKSNQLRNIDFKNREGSNSFMSTSNIQNDAAPQALVSTTKGSLEQQFGYIEIPLEMEYSIVASKFGLNVIGGFSTLFLNNNDVFSVLENEKLLIGEANNINSTSYSANFGLGLNYNVSNTLKLNLEPMFKYQINTFTNTSGDFRPYYIGVYTGFSFKF
ncbi:hypothetical protein [uncultured Gelidibacter sp.]|uniref:hypothetical protein n=1 Tax=uncultured Gelidibacter sp. TaxID=259318 RepID=UPI00261ED87C|nr:hypothetical protein [uncultured Gelidibacter sp.]